MNIISVSWYMLEYLLNRFGVLMGYIKVEVAVDVMF